ncbi:hypothetical protein [Undibacterium sp.]|uniref:hypothetical protein n=1 Tax=Undibacterium sp. TaxID=1914977 RepID=UPI002B9EF2D0|nr:hypothetical protein [Undibacterium sp.]HTD05871.1 hypothetical protein [Undibacterium sp.]
MQTDLSHLPQSAQKLIALIGLPATLRLVDAHGGHGINLYNSENSLERMTETVGREAAQKLLRFYGNDPFTVPLCHRALKAVRNAEILAEFDRLTMQEGLSARASVIRITRHFNPYIHERTIWRILKLTNEASVIDPRQLSLL